LIRSLAVLKLWTAGGPGLDFTRLSEHLSDKTSFDVTDLRNLLRRDQVSDIDGLIRRISEGFRFLAQLTDLEKLLAADNVRRCRREADELIDLIRRQQFTTN